MATLRRRYKDALSRILRTAEQRRGGSAMKVSHGMGWGAELGIVFASGFLLATFLWLGLWFFVARPVQPNAARQTETVLRERETALEHCAAARNECSELNGKIQAENQRVEAKLKEALVGWGRCIRSQGRPEASGGSEPLKPRPAVLGIVAIH